ncbi:MAG: sulfite exporter TauE/SafE family protein [Alphaproteobacteria bacterium]|nr:sulfite exporter TauE/SafE family protein [Alphaproteobacteria bacterium]
MFDALPGGDLVAAAIAFCRELGSNSNSLFVAMGLAGLAGGFLHCSGMCGPFVLAQTAGDHAYGSKNSLGEWRRLQGAILIPYHLGRATTYAVFGGIAASLTSQIHGVAAFRWLAAALLLTAAILFASQAWNGAMATSGQNGALTAPWLRPLTRLAAPLARGRGVGRRYGLGVALGFLPCGMIYAALAAAAATGDTFRGAAAMTIFAVATIPALVGVGYVGSFFARRWRSVTRIFASALFAANAMFLTMLAWTSLPH